MLDGNCTFNVLVYADADSEVPLEWGDSDAKEINNGEKVQLRNFSTSSHRVDTLVSYRYDICTMTSWSSKLTYVGSLIDRISFLHRHGCFGNNTFSSRYSWVVTRGGLNQEISPSPEVLDRFFSL
jgi:hypothetical protein